MELIHEKKKYWQKPATVPLSFLSNLVFLLQTKTAIIKNLLPEC
jgi:hypothetical protein